MKKGLQFPIWGSKWRAGLRWDVKDQSPTISGEVFWELDGPDGVTQGHKKNLVMYDAGILIAYLVTTSGTRNPLMLALGTGASGQPNNPDAPDPRYRRLAAEVARKPFATVTSVTSTGAVAGVQTHVVDLTVSFTALEANSPLNEMAIISPVSSNPLTTTPNPNLFPTYDVAVNAINYDIMLNYLTFPVLNKPPGSTLTITWRLTF